ncbi:hypothetical protein Amsp01_018960 [Amycolatopsis sp. NBRC 101858]|uniref:hypothetical protein n=1 Tax=Amycolatopsis sp. NBRC 101858 TaxID=3032200 RepID=UPI0024A242E0|nr:hypothetical protein [Amycolatopsis sp. NBRC 101858]GLY35872.1 hypothetical protein Amsp01_018960 [Amycolatopsis sp. NBRC 101858]
MTLLESPGLVAALYRRRQWLWLVAAVPAVVTTLLIMVVLPPDQTLDNVGDWAFKLCPFVFAVLTVSLFPRGRFGPALLVFAVFVYMSYLDTELVMRVQGFARSPDQDFQPVYQFELFVTTFIVLFALLAYRLGGGRTANVLKVGIASILVVISGVNDLTFWALNDVWAAGTKPTELKWASHMIVFLGGPPSVPAAVAFMAVHLVLAAIVVALPVGRWVNRALRVRDSHPGAS